MLSISRFSFCHESAAAAATNSLLRNVLMKLRLMYFFYILCTNRCTMLSKGDCRHKQRKTNRRQKGRWRGGRDQRNEEDTRWPHDHTVTARRRPIVIASRSFSSSTSFRLVRSHPPASSPPTLWRPLMEYISRATTGAVP